MCAEKTEDNAKLTGTTDSVSDETAEEDQSRLHEIFARFQHCILRIVDM